MNRARVHLTVRGFLALLVLSWLMLACGDTTSLTLTLPDPTASVSPTLTPDPTRNIPTPETNAAVTTAAPASPKPSGSGITSNSVTYDFDADLPEQDRSLIQQGVELAKKAFGETGKVRITATRATAKYQSNPNVFAASAPNEIIVFPYSAVWQNASKAERITTLVHEYYHLEQYRLSGSSSLGYQMSNRAALLRPLWLVEGSAEYFAYKVVGEAGLLSFARVRTGLVKEVRREPFDLSNLEAKLPDQELVMDPYSVGFLATEYLLDEFGGQDALTNYWQLSLSTSKWQEAFRQAFKLTTTQFYQKFEQYRQKAFPSDIPVGVVPLPLFHGSLKLGFLGTMDPGILPGVNPQSKPYLFTLSGVNVRLLSPEELENGLSLPDGVSQWSYLGGNCIAIFFEPNTPAGSYRLGFELPDGHSDELKFQHPSTQKIKIPTLAP